MVSGDHFYGAVGVIFWLVAGYTLALEQRTARQVQSKPKPKPHANAEGTTNT
jgi:hypothetical protein